MHSVLHAYSMPGLPLCDSPLKGVEALVPSLVFILLPTDANNDATTAMAARLMLGRPKAPAKPWPRAQAATAKASASAMLSTVGEVAIAVVMLTVATALGVLVLAASPGISPAVHEHSQQLLLYCLAAKQWILVGNWGGVFLCLDAV